MRGVVLGLLVLHGFLANLAAADKTWVGGVSSNWFEPANWDPAGVPASTDSIAITNVATVVITDNFVVASLELRHATLVVSNQLTVTNLLLADFARLSAWLTRPTPITNPPSGSGIIEVPESGHLGIGPNFLEGTALAMEGTKLNLRGSGACTNRTSILLFFRSELNVYGTLTVSDEVNFDGANGPPPGTLNNYGAIQRPSGTNLTLQVALTNRGTVYLQSGTMRIGGGVNSGAFNTSFGATQLFAGTFQWQSGGSFTGAGTVCMVRGTFDCGTNDLLIPNLYGAFPGMTLQGTNTITVIDATLDAADLAGAGDLNVTSHLTLPTSGEREMRGMRRLINRGKATFGTNSAISFLDRSSFRNEGFLELSQGAAISSFQALAPHPDVSVLNLGTIISQANTTNTIWIRTTNSGTLQVNGRLQLQHQNAVQASGSTIVNGTLSVLRTYRIDSGFLSGNGVVQGIVRSAGSITPGSSIGRLSLLGSLTNHGAIAIELRVNPNGAMSDVLYVTDHLRLGGSLALRYSPVFAWPDEGTSWEVLRFGSASGSFNSIQGLDLGGGRVLQPIFSPTNLVLVVSNQPPGHPAPGRPPRARHHPVHRAHPAPGVAVREGAGAAAPGAGHQQRRRHHLLSRFSLRCPATVLSRPATSLRDQLWPFPLPLGREG